MLMMMVMPMRPDGGHHTASVPMVVMIMVLDDCHNQCNDDSGDDGDAVDGAVVDDNASHDDGDGDDDSHDDLPGCPDGCRLWL